MSTRSELAATATGRYGDGRTAASRTLEVAIGDAGLVLRDRVLDTAWIWPFAEIEAATPLDLSSREALLRRKWRANALDVEDVGATLFVTDATFVQTLIAEAPHLTAKRERWRFARPGLLLAAFTVATTVAIWAFNLNPSRAVAEMVPAKSWEAIGTQMLAGLGRSHPECTGEAGRAALDKLMRRIVMGDYETKGYSAKVVTWDIQNAFALPGRRIVLTSRLIERAGSAEEIAGVLAHEVGHGLERHPEAGIVRILGLATLAKIFASGVGDTFSNSGLMLVQLRYSRDAEREADLRAAELLRAAGISVRPLATFLDRLRGSSGGSEPLGGILSTHPGIDERVAAIRKFPDYPTTPAMSAADLAALRSICKK